MVSTHALPSSHVNNAPYMSLTVPQVPQQTGRRLRSSSALKVEANPATMVSFDVNMPFQLSLSDYVDPWAQVNSTLTTFAQSMASGLFQATMAHLAAAQGADGLVNASPSDLSVTEPTMEAPVSSAAVVSQMKEVHGLHINLVNDFAPHLELPSASMEASAPQLMTSA